MEGIQKTWESMSHPAMTMTMPKPNEKSMPFSALSQSDLVPYKRLLLRIADECTRGDFRIDERNRDTVRSLFLYFLGQSGPLDPRKGLWLSGPVGTGKSTLLYVFSRFMRELRQGFRVYVCSQVTTEYSLHGDLSRYLDNAGWSASGPVPMCFDELGREPIPAKYFGTELNVMQHILHLRYSYWQTEGLKTYVTTNLFPDEIEKKYGDYIRDRRREMFNLIKLEGTSRR